MSRVRSTPVESKSAQRRPLHRRGHGLGVGFSRDGLTAAAGAPRGPVPPPHCSSISPTTEAWDTLLHLRCTWTYAGWLHVDCDRAWKASSALKAEAPAPGPSMQRLPRATGWAVLRRSLLWLRSRMVSRLATPVHRAAPERLLQDGLTQVLVNHLPGPPAPPLSADSWALGGLTLGAG